MLVSPLPPFFLDTYCRSFCMVISFLVLWSICLSSSLVHFKNGPEYPMWGTAHVSISLIRFLLYSFVSSNFLVLLKYSFLIFLSSPLVWWYQLPRCPSICRFLFSGRSNFSWSGISIPSIRCRLPLSLLAWGIFLCKITSLRADCIFWPHVSYFPILFHFWQTVWCRPCTLGDLSFPAIY